MQKKNSLVIEKKLYQKIRKSKINIYLANKNVVHNEYLKAFAKGCGGKLLNVQNYEESDVAVVFGVLKKEKKTTHYRGEIILKQKEKGHKTIVIDLGFIRRDSYGKNYFSIGFDNIIGWGNYRNLNMPDDRIKKLNLNINEWKNNKNGHIILCGQIPWDASCQDIDINDWLNKTSKEIQKRTNKKIIYRPHPKSIDYNPKNIPGCEVSLRPISLDFNNAYCTVVYNSTSAVESIISGIPTMVLGKGCVAEKVSTTSLDFIDKLNMPDIWPWLSDLAYAQWNKEEMERGEPWFHLTR